MNVHDSNRLATPLSIELLTGDWILLVAILNSIIESSVPMMDSRVSEQTVRLAYIREKLDRATD
nr:hypothetical protein [uncultured Mediterranean phage uvMED]